MEAGVGEEEGTRTCRGFTAVRQEHRRESGKDRVRVHHCSPDHSDERQTAQDDAKVQLAHH